ncbi:MAG: hypothetical protein ABI462_10005, partial [Ignavibacteria bacterium]
MKKKFVIIFFLSFVFAAAQSQTMSVTYKATKDSNASMNYIVSAVYPEVDFGPDALMGVRGIAQDINNSIDTTVTGIIKNFVNDVSNMPEKTVNGNGSTLEITSQGWVSNGSLLSAELTTF